MSFPEQPFRFMALPAGIILQVFRLVLYQEKEVAQMRVDKPTKNYARLPVDTRVFAVNTSVKEEAE